MLMGAIIPTLIHRILSELRSKACLGESSTRIGDLLGSPRVPPLSFSSDFFFRRRAYDARFVGLVCPGRKTRAADIVLGANSVAAIS